LINPSTRRYVNRMWEDGALHCRQVSLTKLKLTSLPKKSWKSCRNVFFSFFCITKAKSISITINWILEIILPLWLKFYPRNNEKILARFIC
jgi:hypothetical protein